MFAGPQEQAQDMSEGPQGQAQGTSEGPQGQAQDMSEGPLGPAQDMLAGLREGRTAQEGEQVLDSGSQAEADMASLDIVAGMVASTPAGMGIVGVGSNTVSWLGVLSDLLSDWLSGSRMDLLKDFWLVLGCSMAGCKEAGMVDGKEAGMADGTEVDMVDGMEAGSTEGADKESDSDIHAMSDILDHQGHQESSHYHHLSFLAASPIETRLCVSRWWAGVETCETNKSTYHSWQRRFLICVSFCFGLLSLQAEEKRS